MRELTPGLCSILVRYFTGTYREYYLVVEGEKHLRLGFGWKNLPFFSEEVEAPSFSEEVEAPRDTLFFQGVLASPEEWLP